MLGYQVKPEAAYLYDAVWIYARAADTALRQGLCPRNGTAIMEYIKGAAYRSMVPTSILSCFKIKYYRVYTTILFTDIDILK